MTSSPLVFDDNLRRALQQWCPQCGYDLRGSPSPRCSECGFEPPPGFFAFAARRVDVITAVHLASAPFAFVVWLLGAPLFFALIPDDYPDNTLVLLSIGYILLIVPVFIVVVRVMRRIIPLQPAFKSAFYAGPSGFGVRKLKSPCVRIQRWSRFYRTRTKPIGKQGVRIRIFHLLWPYHVHFDLRLDPDAAQTLMRVCRHWAANSSQADKDRKD